MGRQKIDFMAEARIYVPSGGGWCKSHPSDIHTLCCSRNLLEFAIRAEIARNHHTVVRILEGAAATGFAMDGKTPSRVAGVRVRMMARDGGAETLIPTDLVVDATGRNTPIQDWLDRMGLGRPEQVGIDSYFGYATRRLRMRAVQEPGWKAMVILGRSPANPRLGFLHRIENGGWELVLQGSGRNYPPTDEKGFAEFAKMLEDSAIYDILVRAEPASPISGYRGKGSRRFLYERMESWPDNLVCVGDSVSAFNPFYAQGMTVAAQDALVLARSLEGGDAGKPGFARKFQNKIARANSLPWAMAAAEDLRWPTTEGGQLTLGAMLNQKFADHIMRLVPKNRAAMQSFVEITHMLRPPSPSLLLLRPGLALTVGLSMLGYGRPAPKASAAPEEGGLGRPYAAAKQRQ